MEQPSSEAGTGRQLVEAQQEKENLGKFPIGVFEKEREGKEFAIDTLADVIGAAGDEEG